eukprot:scaffold14980_cov83-Isochrysis_galbana.AAC.1
MSPRTRAPPNTPRLAMRVPNWMALFCSRVLRVRPSMRPASRRMSLSPPPSPRARSQISGSGNSARYRMTASSKYGWRASLPQSDRTRSSLPRLRSHNRSRSTSRAALRPAQPPRAKVVRWRAYPVEQIPRGRGEKSIHHQYTDGVGCRRAYPAEQIPGGGGGGGGHQFNLEWCVRGTRRQQGSSRGVPRIGWGREAQHPYLEGGRGRLCFLCCAALIRAARRSSARNRGSGARNRGSGARNRGSGARNRGSGARNRGSGARNRKPRAAVVWGGNASWDFCPAGENGSILGCTSEYAAVPAICSSAPMPSRRTRAALR